MEHSDMLDLEKRKGGRRAILGLGDLPLSPPHSRAFPGVKQGNSPPPPGAMLGAQGIWDIAVGIGQENLLCVTGGWLRHREWLGGQDTGYGDGPRLTLVLGLATLIAAFGSSFQYGYNVAAVNSPSELMKQFYNDTYANRTGESIEPFHLTLLWSLTVSMYPFGGFIGSLLVGPLVNKLGRKGALLFNNIFSIVPAVLMGCSKVAAVFELIIVSRLLVGICAGVSSNVVPMYLGELAPKNLRGALGVVPQLFITVGILVAQLFGLRNLLANDKGWPVLLGLTGVPAALQLLLLPFFPESPRYLLTHKRNEDAARKALQRLRGWDAVDEELVEIRQEDEAEKAEGFISVWKLFFVRSLRWQLVSIIVLMAGQQLSGVNAIYYYADQIYLSAGVKSDDVQYVTVGTGAVNVFMTICTVFVVELWGRRLLLLLGFSTCLVACVVLTVALALQDQVSWMPFISITCVIVYVIGHAIGPSPIPALLIAEMFLQASRPAAFMVGGSVHWLSNFAVGLIFPFIQEGLGPYCFIVFAVICLLTTIYTALVMPETKNRTFMEINQAFAKKNMGSDSHLVKEELADLPPTSQPMANFLAKQRRGCSGHTAAPASPEWPGDSHTSPLQIDQYEAPDDKDLLAKIATAVGNRTPQIRSNVQVRVQDGEQELGLGAGHSGSPCTPRLLPLSNCSSTGLICAHSFPRMLPLLNNMKNGVDGLLSVVGLPGHLGIGPEILAVATGGQHLPPKGGSSHQFSTLITLDLKTQRAFGNIPNAEDAGGRMLGPSGQGGQPAM
ncbi:solute carrier family 2, facilitated glucose transporter member 5-like [Ctenodactylus gundi]